MPNECNDVTCSICTPCHVIPLTVSLVYCTLTKVTHQGMAAFIVAFRILRPPVFSLHQAVYELPWCTLVYKAEYKFCGSFNVFAVLPKYLVVQTQCLHNAMQGHPHHRLIFSKHVRHLWSVNYFWWPDIYKLGCSGLTNDSWLYGFSEDPGNLTTKLARETQMHTW